jgi:hypothetical protein
MAALPSGIAICCACWSRSFFLSCSSCSSFDASPISLVSLVSLERGVRAGRLADSSPACSCTCSSRSVDFVRSSSCAFQSFCLATPWWWLPFRVAPLRLFEHSSSSFRSTACHTFAIVQHCLVSTRPFCTPFIHALSDRTAAVACSRCARVVASCSRIAAHERISSPALSALSERTSCALGTMVDLLKSVPTAKKPHERFETMCLRKFQKLTLCKLT